MDKDASELYHRSLKEPLRSRWKLFLYLYCLTARAHCAFEGMIYCWYCVTRPAYQSRPIRLLTLDLPWPCEYTVFSRPQCIEAFQLHSLASQQRRKTFWRKRSVFDNRTSVKNNYLDFRLVPEVIAKLHLIFTVKEIIMYNVSFLYDNCELFSYNPIHSFIHWTFHGLRHKIANLIPRCFSKPFVPVTFPT